MMNTLDIAINFTHPIWMGFLIGLGTGINLGICIHIIIQNICNPQKDKKGGADDE